MATPIPYSIKKGDTLSKIAQKLGIDDWQHLRTYHNNNCQPISEQIAEQLKEGKTLLTPSQDEIDKMNGKSRKIIEEKQDEEKEIAAHEDDKKEQKQVEASKGEHDNKYFVVHGAECFCDQSEVPKKLAKLQVTTHSKVVFNDEDGKYAATEEDKTFDPMASTFGNCKLKPSGSSYLPCVIAPAPKWDKPYDKTKILGKKVLTEISELKCLTGGKIAIEKHGQTDAVLTQHAENTDALELAMANPALKMPPKKSDIPNVSYIIAKKIENHSDFKEIRSNERTGFEKIVARPHEEITFQAKLKSGNEKLISWLVYEGHDGKNEQRLFLKEQIGREFKNSFEPGKYRIEGYGQPKEGKSDKNYPSASFDLEIAHNRLDGSALLPASGDFAIGSVGKHKLRKGFPASFDPKFLMTPTDEEADRLKMYVQDEAGNMASPFAVIMSQLTFTPKNSGVKYNFIAEYTDAEGNMSIQNYEAETIPNSVLGVKHETETVRPYTNMNFSVTKTKFSVLVKSDADLTIPELTDIKWSFNGKIMGQGRTFALPGTMLSAVGEYTVKAQALSSLGFGKSSKNEFDEWRFKVAENDVVSCSLNTNAKVGKQIFITPKYIFKDKLPAEKVSWHLEGSGQNVMSEVLNYKAMSAGKKIISCKINSQKGIRIIVDVKQAVINDVMFTDSNGLKIEKASWGQKINIWIDQKELVGEKLEIQLRDSDAFDDDDVAPLLSIPAYDGKLIPIILEKNIKSRAGKHGELYVKVTAPEIIALNEGKKLGKVDVLDAREIYSAQIGSEDGKEKHMVVDYDEISWFYAHTRGIKTDEKLYLEIRDSVVGRDPLLLLAKNVEVDESGVIKVKINWGQIQNKVSFLTVYAIVKENDANGNVLYDANGSFSMATAKLMKSSSLVKEVGYKSAVMVEGSNIHASNNGNCVCKEYDLIWGNKVSCEFRKKVVEIAKRLGKDPNLLMAAMALETDRTFLPTAGKGTSYIGLIQFGDDAAESVGTTRNALLKMAALEQLDYVEKYLSKKKDKLVTLTDFYLSILMPVDVGKGSSPDHIVFDNECPLEYKKDGKTLTDLSKSRHYGYRQNSAFHLEDGEKKKVKKGGGKKYDGAGKTYIWEIEKEISKYFSNGKTQKASVFLCNKDTVPNPDTDLGTWNVVITEKYTGKKCTHDKKHRNNCRRGKIEVFDHNKKSVLTINDCLLEG